MARRAGAALAAVAAVVPEPGRIGVPARCGAIQPAGSVSSPRAVATLVGVGVAEMTDAATIVC